MLKHGVFFLLLLISLSAQASGVATFKGMDNGKLYMLSLEYLNKNTSRINMDANNDVLSYLLFKDNSAQVVSAYQGNTLVMDLASVSQMAQSLGVMSVLGIGSENLMIKVLAVEPTGKKEKVAGIEGEVYKLTWIRNKVKQQDEIVVSKDRRVWEYTEAWIDAVAAINKSSPTITIQGDELLHRLNKEKLGILRIGKRMRLVSVQNRSVSPERFVAPDTSFTIPGLGELLGSL